MNGQFVIDLDYELRWGIFDSRPVEDYLENLQGVSNVIPRLVALADTYNIKLTFAIVGFLFAKDKYELLDFSPKIKPTYKNEKFNPYSLIESIGNNELDNPLHFAHSKINFIIKNGNHEIGTHTYYHFYCQESGQTVEQFESDIKSTLAIAKHYGINIKSIVFPRNMINSNCNDANAYLNVLQKHGIKSYRGNQPHFIYDSYTKSPYQNGRTNIILRFLDSYFKVVPKITYNLFELNRGNRIINIPTSSFLRPFNKQLSFLSL